MIRVNLAKTHNYASPGTQTAIAMDQAALMASESPHPAVKVGAMFILSILLYGYESYNLSQKQIELAVVNEQVQKIELEASQFGAVANVVEDLSKEKEKLNEQLSVIQNISKKRAFKLEAIKQVQESMLEDLWLSELIVDQNLLIFKGYSRSPTSVQKIVDNLNKVEFVENAMNRELKRVNLSSGEFNSFDIEAKVKN